MEFDKKDVTLQRAIIRALWERYTINLNKETRCIFSSGIRRQDQSMCNDYAQRDPKRNEPPKSSRRGVR